MPTVHCAHCYIVPIAANQKYCDACTEEMIAWLYHAEEERLQEIEDKLYLEALEEKQLNFYFER